MKTAIERANDVLLESLDVLRAADKKSTGAVKELIGRQMADIIEYFDQQGMTLDYSDVAGYSAYPKKTVTPGEMIIAQGLTRERVGDVLCTALDVSYGSSYTWCRVVKRIQPTSWEFSIEPGEEKDFLHYREDYPLNPGGALILVDTIDEDHPRYTLDLEAIKRGLDIMAELCAEHFADIVNENEDAITGNVLVQCALLGDIVYG